MFANLYADQNIFFIFQNVAETKFFFSEKIRAVLKLKNILSAVDFLFSKNSRELIHVVDFLPNAGYLGRRYWGDGMPLFWSRISKYPGTSLGPSMNSHYGHLHRALLATYKYHVLINSRYN